MQLSILQNVENDFVQRKRGLENFDKSIHYLNE
jgi:hypothetical protein